MSFYNRSSYGQNRFFCLNGFGALPTFAPPGDLDALARGVLDNWLASTPPGSPAGNIRQLIARAQELQRTSAPIFAHPEGSTAASNAAGLESSLEQGWNDLVANARRSSDLNRQLASVPDLNMGRPRPSCVTSTDPACSIWDGNRTIFMSDVARKTREIDAAIQDRDARLGPRLGANLIKYVITVGEAASAVQRLIDAERTKKTVEVEVKVAETTGKKIRAETRNVQAETELVVAKKEAKKAASAIGGMSPIMIAAIALPLLGAAAYFFTRKKGGSVAGYRRQRRRSGR